MFSIATIRALADREQAVRQFSYVKHKLIIHARKDDCPTFSLKNPFLNHFICLVVDLKDPKLIVVSHLDYPVPTDLIIRPVHRTITLQE